MARPFRNPACIFRNDLVAELMTDDDTWDAHVTASSRVLREGVKVINEGKDATKYVEVALALVKRACEKLPETARASSYRAVALEVRAIINNAVALKTTPENEQTARSTYAMVTSISNAFNTAQAPKTRHLPTRKEEDIPGTRCIR